jgi:hypothetical protein
MARFLGAKPCSVFSMMRSLSQKFAAASQKAPASFQRIENMKQTIGALNSIPDDLSRR